MARELSAQERKQIREMARKGATHREILAAVGRSAGVIAKLVQEERGGGRAVHLVDWEPGPLHLTLPERPEIALALERGKSFSHRRRIGPGDLDGVSGGGRQRWSGH